MINIYIVGKVKNDYFIQEKEKYLKRISKYIKINIINSKECKIKDSKKKVNIECDELIKKINRNNLKVILTEKGKQVDSIQFSELVNNNIIYSKDIAFIIGGAYGFSEEFLKYSDIKLSLSKMTYQHDIALLVLLEQIYRAFTIINNEPYNK